MTKGWIILLGLLCLTTTVSAMGSLESGTGTIEVLVTLQ